MKKFVSMCLTMVLSLSLVAPLYMNVFAEEIQAAPAEDYTQFVDPFVCTDVDYGQLVPGSMAPYALMKLCPDTYPHDTLDHAGYDYSKHVIEGFSHTRIEGVGGQGSGGDVLITPTYVRYTGKPSAASRAMNIVKDRNGDKVETASPGYYSVNMWPKDGTNDNTREQTGSGSIKAELTSDIRTGYHKYTLPYDGEISLTVDLKYTYHDTGNRDIVLDVEQMEDKVTLSGRFSGGNVSGNGKYTMYFYMETNQPAIEVNLWKDGSFGAFPAGETVTGNDVGAVLTFMGRKNKPLEVKVSVSPISAEQARRDMEAEMPGWNFGAERDQAKGAWNEVLSKVKVTSSATSDPDGRLKKLFYTHLYHMFTMPMNATSTDGVYRAINPANDLKVADGYTHYDSWTLWDDFKKYPIVGLILPDVYADIVRSIADALEAGMATWSHNYQVVPNVRTEHAVALLADGVAKGVTDISNLASAYEKAKAIADGVSDATRMNRVDKMVEYCYDDWAISLLAKELYDQTGEAQYMEDYDKYSKRAFLYKQLYRADAVVPAEQYRDMVGMGEGPVGGEPMGLLWGKNTDGSWRSGNPEAVGDQSLYQGSLWQYSFWDTNDISGLMDLMGGKDAMYRQLSYLMGEYAPDTASRMLHTSTNEIDLHSPYLFNTVGRPWRTQYWTRQIYADKSFSSGYTGGGAVKDYLYKLQPAGYLNGMDDDAGTMASMYVAAAVGLFPITPGDPTFQLTGPFFEEIRLDVGNGKEFVIKSDNVSPKNIYIQSATLNGAAFERTWLAYEEIARGGELHYTMAPTPSAWGKDSPPAPSMSDSVDSSIYEDEQLAYSSLTFHETKANTGASDTVVTITARDDTVSFKGENGPVAGGDYSINNLPAGLGATLVKTGGQTLELQLEGNAKSHRISDSIDTLQLTLADSLFNGTVTSKRKEQMLKIQFMDASIEYSKDTITEDKDGSFDDTLTATLTGEATFGGEAGEDFAATGKVDIGGLPEGLAVTAKKVDDNTLELHFTGQIAGYIEDRDGLNITFDSDAFNGLAASEISGSNYGGMKPISILSPSRSADNLLKLKLLELEEMVKTAAKTDLSGCTKETAEAFEAALANAKQLLENVLGTTIEQVQQTLAQLQSAIDGLVRLRDAGKIELESYDAWNTANNPDNNNPLKTENSNDKEESPSTQSVANTYSGAWLQYRGIQFGDEAPYSFSIRYCGNTGNCFADSAVELRLGNKDGELLATVPTPPTAGSWGAYATATAELGEEARAKLTGRQDICLVLIGTRGSGKIYAGNFNWMMFEGAAAHGGEKLEAEAFDAWDITVHPSGNGPLKTEDGGVGGSVANTFDGAWLKFDVVDFGAEAANTLTVNYKAKGGACPADARLEVRLGAPDESGELVATVDTPATGSGWGSWTAASTAIANDRLQGRVKDVYLVFRGDMAANPSWYIMNLDYAAFTHQLETETRDPYDKMQMEEYDMTGGGLAIENGDDGKVIANTNSGEWLGFKAVDFGETTPEAITVRYSAANNVHADANLEIRIGSIDGEVLSRVMIPRTGGWANIAEIRVELDAVGRQQLAGVQDLYIKFAGSGSSWVGNFNWIRFELTLEKPVLEKAYGTIQAEHRDMDPGDIGIENVDIVRLYNGEWLGYRQCNFSGDGLEEITLRYANNASRMGDDCAVDVYLNDREKAEPDLTIPLPVTGDSSYVYGTVTGRFATPVAGSHAVYLVFRTNPAEGREYAAKLDWLQFKERNEELDALAGLAGLMRTALNKADIQGDLLGLFIPLRVALLAADQVLGAEVPNKEEITAALQALGALEKPVVTKLVAGEMATLIAGAKALREQDTDPTSYEAVQAALPAAEAIVPESTYGEYSEAFDALYVAYTGRSPEEGKQALNSKVNEAQKAQDSVDEYVASSKSMLPAALAYGRQVLANAVATEEEVAAAINGLEEALAALVPLSNRAGLEQSVTEAQGMLAGGDLLDEVTAALNERIQQAKALLARGNDPAAPVSNAEYSAEKQRLETAMTLAKRYATIPQMTKFAAFLDECEALDVTGYTTSSVQAFRQVVEVGRSIGAAPLGEELLAAWSQVKDAKLALVLRGDTTLLALFNATYGKLLPAAYTAASWAPMQAALDVAKAILADPTDADQQAVDAALDALLAADEGLRFAVYTSPLQEAIAAAEAMLAGGETYIPASREKLEKVLEEAKAMLALPEDQRTAEMILAKTMDLVSAMSQMFEQGDKRGLGLLVSSAGRLDETLYTPASWGVLAEALASAKVVYENENALQDEITAAYDKLEAAVRQLSAKANPSGLKTAIDVAQSIVDNAGSYVPASLEGLTEALEAAKLVYENADAGQAEVDKTASDLLALGMKARKPANKAALKGAMGSVGRLSRDGISQAGLERLGAAMAHAEEVLANPNAAPEEISAAQRAVEEAMHAARTEGLGQAERKLEQAHPAQVETHAPAAGRMADVPVTEAPMLQDKAVSAPAQQPENTQDNLREPSAPAGDEPLAAAQPEMSELAQGSSRGWGVAAVVALALICLGLVGYIGYRKNRGR